MLAVYIISGVVAFALLIWGIVAFYRYVAEKYSYNIFNWINIVMLLLIALSWVGILFAGHVLDIAAARETMNHIVCGAVTAVILIIMFIRNLKHTSWPVAIGAWLLQIISVAWIVLIIVYYLFLSKKREA